MASDLASELRRQALRDHAAAEMDSQDHLDVRDAAGETPQEMHERMLAEDSGEETLDLLEGLRELQGGELVTWKIWRIAGPNGEPLRSGPEEYCGLLGNSQLTMENVASHWGGGKYRVKGRYSNGKIAGGRTITIAADAKRNEESMAQVAAGSSSSFNMSEFLALQSQMDAKREERQRQDRKDFLALILPIAGQIATAVLGRPAGAAPDMAALITALRPVTSPPDPTSQMKGMVETMLLMRKLNGDGDGDSIGSIVAAVAPHAGPVLAALAARPQAAPQRQRIVRPAPGTQPTQPAAARISPASVQQAPPLAAQAQPVVVQPAHHTGVNLDAPTQPMTDETRHMFAQLKPQVDTLVTMARDGADPVETANVFFEQVMINPATDEGVYNRLCDLFENPNAITQIAIFNTGVKEQHVFFEAFQKRVMERIQAEDQAVQNPPAG
jgi:hypothetical protein